MRKVYIIGIGMGNRETITIAGRNAILESKGIVGAKRMVDTFSRENIETIYAVDPKEILGWIDENSSIDPISVLMSGDVGFFSGTEKLKKLFDERHYGNSIEELEKYQVELIPGISSLQYLCAKLSLNWDDVKTISLHGRVSNFIGEIQTHSKVFILTDSFFTPEYLCEKLIEAELHQTTVHVGQRLSYADELIVSGTPQELLSLSYAPLNVVLIENPMCSPKEIVSSGLEDSAFIRGDVPMTKSEVRSVVLSKLKVCEEDILFDIGAGTGSVSIEMALHASKGQVYAIECKQDAIDLINKNKEAFGVTNLHIVNGLAPEALADLPVPDKAFIGGTRGNMDSVLRELLKKNSDIRVVINVVTLESLSDALNALKSIGYELLDAVQLSIAKANERGNYHLMTAENPVFILTAKGGIYNDETD